MFDLHTKIGIEQDSHLHRVSTGCLERTGPQPLHNIVSVVAQESTKSGLTSGGKDSDGKLDHDGGWLERSSDGILNMRRELL